MINKADVVIIGGGIAGISAAYNIAEKSKGKVSVAVLEKKNIAEGATAKSVGAVYYQHDLEIEYKLTIKTIGLVKELDKEPENGINFCKNGLIYTAYTEEEVRDLKEKVKFNQSLGVEVRLLTPEELHDLLPDISFNELTIASYDPEGGYIDQHMLTSTLARKAKELGVKILEDTKVTGIKVRNNRIESVSTEKGIIDTDFIVNASGPWANIIFKMVDLNYPLQRVPGQIYALKPEKKINYKVPLTIDKHSRFYFREETGNIILTGQSDRFYKSGRKDVNPDDYYGYIKKPDNDFQEFICESLEKRFPMLLEADLMSSWVGLRTVTPDGLPIIGETEVEHFICSVGFSGGGIMLSPAVGELIADYIVNGNKSGELEALSIKRFSS